MPAISFSAVQNASSRLTLVLCPATTIDRFTTGDFTAPSPFHFRPVVVFLSGQLIRIGTRGNRSDDATLDDYASRNLISETQPLRHNRYLVFAARIEQKQHSAQLRIRLS
jgi:hypothetical protein